MNESEIRGILLDRGLELFQTPRAFREFAGEPEADRLLNDIEGTPHAFVIACVMDRQIKAQLAWQIPYRFVEKLGDFEFAPNAEITKYLSTLFSAAN